MFVLYRCHQKDTLVDVSFGKKVKNKKSFASEFVPRYIVSAICHILGSYYIAGSQQAVVLSGASGESPSPSTLSPCGDEDCTVLYHLLTFILYYRMFPVRVHAIPLIKYYN